MNPEQPIFIPADEYVSSSLPATMRLHEYNDQTSDCFHYHQFYELVLVLEGSGLHVTQKREYSIFPGDVFLIKPPQIHAYCNLKKLKIANFIYLPELFEKELEMLKALLGYYVIFESDPHLSQTRHYTGRLTLTGESFSSARDLALRIKHEENLQTPGWEFMVRLLFQEFLLLICRSFSRREIVCSEENERISRILRYLEKNYMHRITLADIARHCGCSVPALTRFFRDVFGESLMEHLNSFRLDKAAELLRNSDLPIFEIAGRTGFCDSNYLTKCFSRHFHLSPRAYRRQ